jgi:hypothetical protein
MALRRGAFLTAVLRACGRKNTVAARLRLAAAMLYLRVRRLDFYSEAPPPDVRLVWKGASPTARPFCYVVLDTFGAENVATVLDAYNAVVVRSSFGGEGVLDPSTAPAAQRWTAHCAWLRWKSLAARTIDISLGTLQIRELVKSSRNMIVFQGNLDPTPDSSRIALLGHAVPMPLGAARLARLSRMPLRFVRIRPYGTGWAVHIDAPIPADEAALAARIERELCERPEAWMLWPLFFAHAKPLLSERNGAQTEACSSTVADRGSAAVVTVACEGLPDNCELHG